ncbi:MAG: hypothetical protein LBQ84_08375 [Flavobacteriaceae bacterium]|jgi:hypothetical protein|nr:hypothetical protein [Flavobacteriaceae bacterium]
MYDLKKLHPISIGDLIRIGNDADGGYVISKQQIEKTELLLSFGINDDWSFESDFLQKKNVKLYAFDHSVSDKIFKYRSSLDFKMMLANALMFRISKAKWYNRSYHYLLRISKDFKQFFQEKSHRFFIQKFLGEKDNEIFTRFDTFFSNLPNIKELSVFIKMDIENWEYRTLPQIIPFFDKINGMVIEFHELDIVGEKFEEIINLLSVQFYIAHIHANNFGELIYNTNLPKVLEITFINKAMLSDTVMLSTYKYPIQKLDFPNNKTQDDIVLDF